MQHETIKKAVLQANLADGDVALRALSRIDKDEEFRDALKAVVDAGDDGEALKNVIYSHFSPIQHRHGGYRAKPVLLAEQLRVDISAKDVAKLVNDHALEVLIGLLSNTAIETRLVEFVSDHMEAIVLGVLGLEKDHYRGYRPITSNSSPSHAGAAIQDRIRAKMLPILMDALDAIDLDALADEVVAHDGGLQLKEFYKQHVSDLLRETARDYAAKKAKIDVETYMNNVFGTSE